MSVLIKITSLDIISQPIPILFSDFVNVIGTLLMIYMIRYLYISKRKNSSVEKTTYYYQPSELNKSVVDFLKRKCGDYHPPWFV
jgi:hypothetical protein